MFIKRFTCGLPAEDPKDQFNTYSYPAGPDKDTKSAYHEFVDNNPYIVEIPCVFTSTGEIMKPSEYELELRNAVVEVWFQLQQNEFNKKAMYKSRLKHMT